MEECWMKEKKRSGRFDKSVMKSRTRSCRFLYGRRSAILATRKPQPTVLDLNSQYGC
jgi:hypothetical protein